MYVYKMYLDTLKSRLHLVRKPKMNNVMREEIVVCANISVKVGGTGVTVHTQYIML